MTHPVHHHSENRTKKSCTLFKKIPLCECCERKPAVNFSLLENGWFFTCECTADKERYYVMFESFFSHPGETVDWLGHLTEKSWMNWCDFMLMMHRFRKATASYY